MNKRILVLLASAVLSISAFASSPRNVKLDNGLSMNVEVISESIFRVQISPDKTFPEALLNRYGVVKTDWPEVKVDYEFDAGQPAGLNETYVFSTGKATLCIAKANGAVTLKDADGKVVVRNILFRKPGSPEVRALAEAVIDKFGSLVVAKNDGIIGDDTNSKNKRDTAEAGDPAHASIISISMEDGERFYGGGSTSREHIQHRGEMLRMWTAYQHTEIPMPFMMSSRGWGIFNNTTRKNHFDVGCTNPERFNIYNTADYADFYLMLGSDMPSVLDLYTQITGRTYVLPKWAYGFAFGPNMREDQWAILSDAANFRQMGVPVDLFWLEPQWMEKRYDFSTKKKWNYDRFSPEPYWLQNSMPKKYYPRLFVGKLNSMGIHLGLWLCEEYDHSIIEEDLIAEREGRPQSGLEHWPDHLTTFMDMGIDGFKLDPARTIDEHPTWKYHNGLIDKEMHNLNQVLLTKQIASMTRKHTGKRSWHHYCGGWAGTQHWTAANSGDNGGGLIALYDQHNLGMSGFMNLSCDVMSVPREQEMQGLHFGIFLPWVQVNSWFSMMQPFYYSGVEKEMYKFYVKLRYQFIPYIYSNALEGALTGMPMVRSMPLEFPDDRNCDDMALQYMFGHQYCVSAYSNDIYLPAGEWINVWTGELVDSKGEVVTRELPYNRAGQFFVRNGAIVPTMPDVEFIGSKPQTDFIIKVYPHGESSFTMYEDDGESYDYENGAISSTLFECNQSGKNVSIVVNPVKGSYNGMPAARNYSFEVRCTSKPRKVLVNGTKVKDWTWEDNTLNVSAGKVAVSDKLNLNVQL
ncbi:MAG: DUF5110 domain-containing protein [Bacteroidales bacterium]|nr:DUF5110 domain-containing protein [Bacteroidales bacterium]